MSSSYGGVCRAENSLPLLRTLNDSCFLFVLPERWRVHDPAIGEQGRCCQALPRGSYSGPAIRQAVHALHTTASVDTRRLSDCTVLVLLAEILTLPTIRVFLSSSICWVCFSTLSIRSSRCSSVCQRKHVICTIIAACRVICAAELCVESCCQDLVGKGLRCKERFTGAGKVYYVGKVYDGWRGLRCRGRFTMDGEVYDGGEGLQCRERFTVEGKVYGGGGDLRWRERFTIDGEVYDVRGEGLRWRGHGYE